jgi:hypothetical protein
MESRSQASLKFAACFNKAAPKAQPFFLSKVNVVKLLLEEGVGHRSAMLECEPAA